MSRLRAEIAFALLFAIGAIVTAIWSDWIEALGFDPDHGDGTAEWLIVAALGVLAVGAAALAARGDRHRQVLLSADHAGR